MGKNLEKNIHTDVQLNHYAVYPKLTQHYQATPLQYSCLENPMDAGAWWAAVHGVARTWLSDFTFTFHFHALEKEMATHSSIFAWRIPRMAEPGRGPSMGSHRVGHDWSDLAAAAAYFNKNLKTGLIKDCILWSRNIFVRSQYKTFHHSALPYFIKGINIHKAFKTPHNPIFVWGEDNWNNYHYVNKNYL